MSIFVGNPGGIQSQGTGHAYSSDPQRIRSFGQQAVPSSNNGLRPMKRSR